MENEFTSTDSLKDKNVLIIISGGISAYKSLELIRLLKKAGIRTPAILTKGGEQFITPLSVSGLSGEAVYTDLFSLKDEQEMGHIRLSREADLIVVAPASANMMARTAHGMADDLASAVLLASDKDIIFCPAMNPHMWNNPATQDNIKTLKQRGLSVINPDAGEMACGEIGAGRLPEPQALFEHICERLLQQDYKPLKGMKAIVTAGPTYEKIDPVRFIGNRSSGKQGYAIAEALTKYGASVDLISGPTKLDTPAGVKRHNIESAAEMHDACESLLPADIAICTAAVADWHVDNQADEKMKKREDGSAPALRFAENKDILKSISTHTKHRPALVVGFAAETEDVKVNATNKIKRKSCDMLLANDVSEGQNVFGGDENTIMFLENTGSNKIHSETWEKQNKKDVAEMLVSKIIQHLEKQGCLNHTGANITKLEAKR